MKVRWKIVAVLIVPLCALVTLAWVGISQRRQVAASASRVRAIVDLAQSTTAVMQGIENEAIVSSVYVASNGAQGADVLAGARSSTDQAVTALRRRLAGFHASGVGVDMTRAVGAVTGTLSGVTSARAGIDAKGDPGRAAIAALEGPLGTMNTLVAQVASQETEPTVAISLAAYATLTQAKQYEALRLASLASVSAAGSATPDQIGALRNVAAQEGYFANAFLALAPDSSKTVYKASLTGPSMDQVARTEAAVLAAPTGPVTLDPAVRSPLNDLSAVLASHRSVELSMETSIGGQASKRADDAQRAVDAYILVALATLIFCVVSASLVGRSITGPLRRLSSGARRVASEELPKLVDTIKKPVSGVEVEFQPLATGSRRDEIGELAEAFDAIQRTAIGVAREQSELLRKGIGDLFVNLARRNQSLIDRQIAFLDELEAHEADPDTLEDLFKLDHLATRMRRNAESLLVLAGVESQRRWGRPVAVADVVRAAVAEVEDYARVHISALDERLVLGNAAADVAHLLAELFDNATQFSPPATHVEVRGGVTEGGYLITITDLGLGMSPEQLAEANDTVQRPPITGLGLSRSLGFTVVGRLAARYGILVELTPNPVGGITCSVVLPDGVLAPAGGPQFNPYSAHGTPSLLTRTPAVMSPLPPPVAEQAPASQETEVAAQHVAQSGQEGAPLPDRRSAVPTPEATPWGRPLDVPPAVWERLMGASNRHWDRGAEPVAGESVPGEPATLAEALPPAPEGFTVGEPEPLGDRGSFTAAGLPRRGGGSTAAASATPTVSEVREDGSERPPAGAALPKRVRGGALEGDLAPAPAAAVDAGNGDRSSSRTPEQIRDLLSSYRGGLMKGREKPAKEETP